MNWSEKLVDINVAIREGRVTVDQIAESTKMYIGLVKNIVSGRNTVKRDIDIVYRCVAELMYRKGSRSVFYVVENQNLSSANPLPTTRPRRTKIADMQRVCAVLDKFDRAGYTTISLFVNAVMIVRPTLDPNDVACFYDFLIHDPAFCDNMEAVYNILTSNLTNA